MQNLKVTLIQAKLAWEDIESNLAGFDQKIDGIMEETHL
ncbi:MAG: nitrilase family protein, partial [Deltaproteobacteria bacterium]|nr:nitrilase family protein [Deltaproteobacteria bacterium]